MQDPYEILEVTPQADEKEIRKAYRRLAKKLHPDLNPGDAIAEARFKQVSAAYEILSDTEKRRRFDAGEIDASGAERQPRKFYKDFANAGDGGHPYQNTSGFGDFQGADDIFAELFRRQAEQAAKAPGADRLYRLSISFLTAVNGGTERITLPDGGRLDVTIPAGVDDGQSLRLRGKGGPSRGSGPPGDAIIEISVERHGFFVRDGKNIRLELPVSLKEAVLGARVETPTPSGAVMLTIPKNSGSGTMLRLKGKGVPHKSGAGDELVTLKVVLPSEPDAELESFLETWTPADEDLRGRMKV